MKIVLININLLVKWNDISVNDLMMIYILIKSLMMNFILMKNLMMICDI